MASSNVGLPALPPSPARLAARLSKLRNARRRWQEKRRARGVSRQQISEIRRAEILAKTAGLCHLCGGKISGDWSADHVLAHRRGGRHRLDNFLAAHRLCNGYRWDYSPQELQWVLAIGIWARLEMERQSPLGAELLRRFHATETRKRQRGQRHGRKRTV